MSSLIILQCQCRSSYVASAFRTYEAIRRPRTAHVALQARRIGAIGQWENPWIARGRDLVTSLVLARSPAMQLNAIYSYEV
jgi:hypothetical protein